jgi:hypothetical protein
MRLFVHPDSLPRNDSVLSALTTVIRFESRLHSFFELLQHTNIWAPAIGDDRVNLSPPHSYPANVATIVDRSQRPIRFGDFPEFDLLFCICRKEVYF